MQLHGFASERTVGGITELGKLVPNHKYQVKIYIHFAKIAVTMNSN